MNEQEDTLFYSLTSNLARSVKSVGAKRYSALMKSSGTFGDEELQEALANEPGAKSTAASPSASAVPRRSQWLRHNIVPVEVKNFASLEFTHFLTAKTHLTPINKG